MAAKKQVFLSSGPNRQIPYPLGWRGEKSGDHDDQAFFISTQPRMLTLDEVVLAAEYIQSIPGNQKLQATGCIVIDPEDPLLQASHDELDAIEKQQKLNSSKTTPGGSGLPVLARVLQIREQGYMGSGQKSIAGA